MGSGVRLLGLNLSPLCTSHVTLGKLLNLGVLFLTYKMGTMLSPTSELLREPEGMVQVIA